MKQREGRQSLKRLSIFSQLMTYIHIKKEYVYSPIQLVNYDGTLDETLYTVYDAHWPEEMNWLSLASKRSMCVKDESDGDCGLS